MKFFKNYLLESKTNNLLKLSQDLENKEKLRKILDKKLKLKIDKYISFKDPKDVVNNYNSLLSSNKSDFNKLFNEKIEGVGRGELLMVYIGDYITLNGGSGAWDLNIGRNKIEDKQIKIDKNGYMHGFRLGVMARPSLTKAYNDIVELINMAKYVIPEIGKDPKLKKRLSTGELTSYIKYLRYFDVNKLPSLLTIDINNEGDFFKDNIKYGNLKNKEDINKILELVKNKKLKSFNEIELELNKDLNKLKESFYFFDSKSLSLYYKESLDNILINELTQGNIKIKVPIN
jgi:hypothetical protein